MAKSKVISTEEPLKVKNQNLVLEVRQARSETQLEFAKALGVGIRSVRRYEAGATLPVNAAVLRNLQEMARKAKVEVAS